MVGVEERMVGLEEMMMGKGERMGRRRKGGGGRKVGGGLEERMWGYSLFTQTTPCGVYGKVSLPSPLEVEERCTYSGSDQATREPCPLDSLNLDRES